MGSLRRFPGPLVSHVVNRYSAQRYGILTSPDGMYWSWTTCIVPLIPHKGWCGLLTRMVPDVTHPVVSFHHTNHGEAYAFHARIHSIVANEKEDEWFAVLSASHPPPSSRSR